MEKLPTLLLPGTNQRVGRVLGSGLRGALTDRSPAVALAGGGVGARPSAAAPGSPRPEPPARGAAAAAPLSPSAGGCAWGGPAAHPRALRPPSAVTLPRRRERPGGRARALPLGRSAAQSATGRGKFPPTCGAENKPGQARPSARPPASPRPRAARPRGRHGARPAPPLPCAQPPP